MTALFEFLPTYTYEDYERWEGKWELIQGHPVAMSPAPSIKHQRISGKIHSILLSETNSCNDCEALQAVDWKIAEDTVVQPDNLVFCGDFENPKYLTKAPSIIFEILSTSTELKDRNAKFSIFESNGVKYFVLVSQFTNIAQVYELVSGKYQLVGEFETETYRFELNSDCSINFDFARIW